MASVDEVAGGTLGDINIAAKTASIILPAFGAQFDAMLSLGIGPLKADLGVQLNAALGAQATLLLQVGNPLAALQAAIAAVAQLQASLTAALSLPPVSISLSAELGATAALAGSLAARLGAIEGLVSAALAVKLPGVKFGDELINLLSAGPAICLAFNGLLDLTTLSSIGSLIQSKFAGGVTFGPDTINPGDPVGGIIIVTKFTSVFTSLGALIATS